jgi:hypothetical protein
MKDNLEEFVEILLKIKQHFWGVERTCVGDLQYFSVVSCRKEDFYPSRDIFNLP